MLAATYGEPPINCRNCGYNPHYPSWPPRNYDPGIIYGPNNTRKITPMDIFTDDSKLENIEKGAEKLGLPSPVKTSKKDKESFYMRAKKGCRICWGVGILSVHTIGKDVEPTQMYCKCVKIKKGLQ